MVGRFSWCDFRCCEVSWIVCVCVCGCVCVCVCVSVGVRSLSNHTSKSRVPVRRVLHTTLASRPFGRVPSIGSHDDDDDIRVHWSANRCSRECILGSQKHFVHMFILKPFQGACFPGFNLSYFIIIHVISRIINKASSLS